MRHTASYRRLAAAAILVAIPFAAAAAPRGDDANRKSKNGRTEGTAGGAAVTIEYGRPSVNGRTLWGDLVPYGKVWRAGADEATTITFDKAVKIDGKPLAAGRYALFLIPTEGDWTVIFNKTADQWGAFKYDAGQDALRVDAKAKAIAPVETLEYTVSGDRVEMHWGDKAVGFAVTPG